VQAGPRAAGEPCGPALLGRGTTLGPALWLYPRARALKQLLDRSWKQMADLAV
jgi:hypothetical protein